jgi:hypothetical protein
MEKEEEEMNEGEKMEYEEENEKEMIGEGGRTRR